MNPTQAENELAHWMKIANEGVQIELQLRKEMLTLEARTVEQCAKIAESYPFDGARFISDGKEIAAAIRAKLTEKK